MENKGIFPTAAILVTLLSLSSLPLTHAMDMSQMQMSNMNLNHKIYDVKVEDQVFQVMVMYTYEPPQTIDFSQEKKSISFELKGLMMLDTGHLETTIPKELLAGEFTATLGGKEIKLIPENMENDTVLHVTIGKSFIEENGIGDSALMVVRGTAVVKVTPEFPVGMIALLGAFAVSTLAIRIAKRKNE